MCLLSAAAEDKALQPLTDDETEPYATTPVVTSNQPDTETHEPEPDFTAALQHEATESDDLQGGKNVESDENAHDED